MGLTAGFAGRQPANRDCYGGIHDPGSGQNRQLEDGIVGTRDRS